MQSVSMKEGLERAIAYFERQLDHAQGPLEAGIKDSHGCSLQKKLRASEGV